MSMGHHFVMPYSPPDYSRPLADWIEEDPQEVMMAASDAWDEAEPKLSPEHAGAK